VTLVLEDFLEQDRLRQLDERTGVLHELSTKGRAQGLFMTLGSTLVVLHAADGQLVLRLGADVVPLRGATAELEGAELRRLAIVRDGAVVARLTYPNPVHPFMDWDGTMAEEEDFDLGLFTANVLGSPRRRRHLLERLGGR
jgi:hypothetical protein